MNAHPRRVKVAALALTIYTLPGHCWVRVIRASQRPLQIFGTSVGRRMARKRAAVFTAGSALAERFAALTREVQQSGGLSGDHKRQVLEAQAALLKQKESWDAACLAANAPPPSIELLAVVTDHLLHKFLRRQHKTLSFKRVLARIDDDIFYFDLLLWFVLPAAFSDHLLGDLNEEYAIKSEKLGRAYANVWYRHQVSTTLEIVCGKGSRDLRSSRR